MKILTTAYTDIGTTKQVNQDALLILQAESERYGDVLLAAVCDGMGGLEKGELASAEMTRAMNAWFREQLPVLLAEGFDFARLQQSWGRLVRDVAVRIAEYGDLQHISLGTTLTALLLLDTSYFIVNVGDSRAYLLSDRLYQLTRDHTVVQREIDLGRLTPAEALSDPRRNVLLQCIGASESVTPEFFSGTAEPRSVFLLCSDGFRHLITVEELYTLLNYRAGKKESSMQEKLRQATEIVKARGETDNITSVLVRLG